MGLIKKTKCTSKADISGDVKSFCRKGKLVSKKTGNSFFSFINSQEQCLRWSDLCNEEYLF